jgi:hypothetical protein
MCICRAAVQLIKKGRITMAAFRKDGPPEGYNSSSRGSKRSMYEDDYF